MTRSLVLEDWDTYLKIPGDRLTRIKTEIMGTIFPPSKWQRPFRLTFESCWVIESERVIHIAGIGYGYGEHSILSLFNIGLIVTGIQLDTMHHIH